LFQDPTTSFYFEIGKNNKFKKINLKIITNIFTTICELWFEKRNTGASWI
jgi:hypothetical protein